MTKKTSTGLPYQERPGDLVFKQPSKTKQSFKDDVEINSVIARYNKTGILPQLRTTPAHYGDYSQPIDYQDAQNKIMLADELFGNLPAQIRRTFNDDPAEFLNFATNPENKEKMQEMGLIPPSSVSERSPDPTGDPADQSGEENASGDVPDNPTEA